MIKLLKKLLGFNTPKVDLHEVLEQSAVIIDVRSKSEFSAGNCKGSINIPLEQVVASLQKIKAYNKPIVVCCRSGNRSGAAMRMLVSKGVQNVINGGSWQNVNKNIK